jgi:hypothetical protein
MRIRRQANATWVVLALALTLVMALASGSSAGTEASGPWTATFTDPAGDASGAPDVTGVAITGDEATGMFTLSVSATGAVPANPDGLTRAVNVFLNTDKNNSTGSASGSEYVLAFVDDPADQPRWWDIYRWDGSAWRSVPETPTMRFALQQGAMSWTFSKSDVGSATGFAVHVATAAGDAAGNLVAGDYAPNDGRWVFDLSGPSKTLTTFVTPVVGKPVTVPAKATAGKRLTVSFPVTHTDAGDKPVPLTSGTIVGAATIAGRVMRHTESFTNGVARISFVVPKTAKGKQLKVKATIKAPSREEHAISFDLATGYMGIVAIRSIGQSTTSVATFLVR